MSTYRFLPSITSKPMNASDLSRGQSLIPIESRVLERVHLLRQNGVFLGKDFCVLIKTCKETN